MPKPQSWQLDIGNYPFSHLTETRFADVDMLGHINNVAMAGLFETWPRQIQPQHRGTAPCRRGTLADRVGGPRIYRGKLFPAAGHHRQRYRAHRVE